MLPLLGLITVLVLLAVIVSRANVAVGRVDPDSHHRALVGGFGLGTGKFVIEGLKRLRR